MCTQCCMKIKLKNQNHLNCCFLLRAKHYNRIGRKVRKVFPNQKIYSLDFDLVMRTTDARFIIGFGAA